MCKACQLTYKQQMAVTPESFAEYTSECLAEIDKVEGWLRREGYCEDRYSFPICDQDAFDSVVAPEGPGLGIARALRLSGLGSRQTGETDFRPASETECRCTQPALPCPCRENAWARRQGA